MKHTKGPYKEAFETTDEESDVTITVTLSQKLADYIGGRIGAYLFPEGSRDRKTAKLLASALANKKGNSEVEVKTKPVQVMVEEMTIHLNPQEVKCLQFLLEQFEENCYMCEGEGGPEGGEAFKDKLMEVVNDSITRTSRS